MAGETTLVAGIAGRYATALFELSRDDDALDTVAGELAELKALLHESADLLRLVRSPVFSAQEQARAVGAIGESAGLSDLTAHFLQVLAKNRRLFILESIISDFHALLADHRNQIIAEIASAVPLTDEQSEELKASLKAKTGRDITLSERVDPSLLGGLIVKIGSRMIDNSMRTKLNNLKIAMKEVG